MWHREYSIETDASARAIWRLFRDVPGWKSWNSGIEHIAIEGAFVEGTRFTMKPPGQDELVSRLLVVRENEAFDDETVVGDVRVVVSHRIEKGRTLRTRVVYEARVTGPGAEEIGPAVSADFPDVLKSLAARAASLDAASS